MSGKKISNSRGWGKNYFLKITHIPSPTYLQLSCQPFKGWGKKRIWHLSKCHPSTKWLARVNQVVVFKTKVLHFKIENTPLKDTNGKRKFSGMLSLLFVDKRKLFAMKLSFEEFNLVFTRRIVALGLFWTNRGSDDSEETWGTFCSPWSRNCTFLKEDFCSYEGFMGAFYILSSAWKKNHKMCIWNWFFAMCSADLTCVNGSTIQFLLREVLLRINFGFLIRNFQEIKLFICRCSFITLAQKTTVRFLETLQTGYSPFLN